MAETYSTQADIFTFCNEGEDVTSIIAAVFYTNRIGTAAYKG